MDFRYTSRSLNVSVEFPIISAFFSLFLMHLPHSCEFAERKRETQQYLIFDPFCLSAHDSVALTVIGATTNPGGSSADNNNDFDSPVPSPGSFAESPIAHAPRSPNNNGPATGALGMLQSNSMLSLLTGGSGGANGSVRGGSREKITAPIPANVSLREREREKSVLC